MTEQDQTTRTRISGGENFFQSLFEKSADAYLILEDNRFVDCNQATVEMLRADSKDEVLATHPSELSPEFQPDGRRSDEKADQMIAIALEQGSNRFEWYHRRLDGDVFPVEVVLNPIPVDGKAVIQTIWRDITERKQVESAIRESEQRLSLMVEQSPLAVIEWNLDFEVTSWNPAAEAIFGYTSEEAIGQHAAGLIVPEEVRPIVDKVWSDLLEQEGGKRSTNENMTKDGRTIVCEWYNTPLIDPDGNTIGVVSIVEDITEQKEAQEEILAAQERFQTVADFTYDWEYWLGVDGGFEYVSPSCERISGYQAEEFIQNAELFDHIVAQEDKDAWHEHVRKYHSEHNDQIGEMEFRIVAKDGDTRWLGHICQAVHDEKDNWLGRRASNRDITEQREAERELQLTRTSIENADDAFFWFDADANFVDVSDRTCEVLGYSQEELLSMQVFDIDPAFPKEAWPTLKQQVQEKGSTTLESQHQTKDGRRFPVQITVSYLEFGGEEVFFSIASDITERKEAQQALQRRIEIEELLTTVSTKLVSANPDEIDEEINHALGLLSAFSQADRSYLFLISDDRTTMDNTHEWCGEGIESHIEELQGIPIDTFPWLMKRLEQFEVVNIDHVADMPAEASAEKTEFQSEGIQSIIVVPIVYQGQLAGFMGYDAVSHQRTWEPDTITALRNVGETFINTIEREKLREEIESAFERRGEQVQLSTEIAQEIATATELSELFEQVVDLTKENLGYYHTQLLQYDPGRDAVVLVTGYGEIGEKMLTQDHQMPMGSGLIGTAAATGETVMRSTLADDPDWQPNPLLPETRGEVAVPIKLRDEVLGVLDVQSDRAGALTDDDRLMLEGLCGQIAIAIDETRLRQEMEAQLNELNSLYRAMSREGWKEYRQRETLPEGFVFDQLGVKQIDPNSLAAELFADVPMVVPGGEEIGSLAVQSTEDNPLYPDEQEFIEQVAEQVALALESARLFEQTQSALAAVQESQDQLTEAMRISQMANWEFDLKELNFHFTDRFFELMGTTAEEHGGYVISAEQYIQTFTHPEDVEEISAEIQQAMSVNDPDYRGLLEYRVINADGETRFVEAQYRIEFDEEGNPAVAYGSHMDVTERKEAEQAVREAQERAQTILASITMPMVITRLSDNVLVYANEPASELVGLPLDELVNSPSPDFYENLDERQEFIAKLQTDGFVNNMQVMLKRGDGTPFWALLSARVFDYQGEESIITTIADITERIEAQEETAKRAAELATVAELGTTVSSLMDPQQMLQTVVDLTKKRFELYHAHIYLMDGDQQALTLEAGAGDVGRQMVAEGWKISLDAEQSLVARAARERQGVIANDIRSEPGFMPNPLLPDTASELAVPLIIGDQVLGVLDVQSDQVDNFTDADVSIKTTLASQVAVALQNVRTYTRTQQQAEHETLVNVISQQIQSTTDIETALQVAVRELGRALGAKRTSVELGAPRKTTPKQE